MKGFQGSKQSRSKEERAKLRSLGICSLGEIDGRVFMPAVGGISMAGPSVKALNVSGRILRTLKQFEEHVQENPGEIVDLMRQHGVKSPDKPKFEFTFFLDGFGVIETTTYVAIGLRA